MHLPTPIILSLLALLPILNTTTAHPNPDAVPNLDLTKRACRSNGCKCQSGYSGVYCAGCPAAGGPSQGRVVVDLGSGGAMNHVYQCSGGKRCCDYGAAGDCKGGGWGRCG